MSDLLKQAIADAKAVRATALANAKAALEEAFTPKLQSMLSAKLQQEIEDEEGKGDEEVNVNVGGPVEEPAPVEVPAELPADAPGAELGGNVLPPDEEPVATEPTDGVAADEGMMDERGTLDNPSEDPTLDSELSGKLEEDESYDLKKSPPGAKTIHTTDDNVAPNVSAKKDGKATPGDDLKKDGGPAVEKAADDYPGEKSGTGKKPTGELPKDFPGGGTREVGKDNNVAPNTSAKKDAKATPNQLEEGEDVEIDDETLDEILKELENEVNLASTSALDEPAVNKPAPTGADSCEYPGTDAANIHELGTEEGAHAEEDEEINLDELLSEKKEEEEDEEEEDESKKKDKEDRGNKAPWMKENISLKAELQEYRKTVGFLRDRINEVNLLNAKLLYTNKLFKQSALTNEQKLRVIESFDLTKSVREAKLVYATLSESLNFGVKAPITTKKPAPKGSATVKSITEGLASKPVASTKPTKPGLLTEGAEMATRFQKLAGIKIKK